ELEVVEESMPSVVFRALDAEGHDVIDVRVLVDGALLTTELDGRAWPLDPGVHVIRYEHGGAAAVEERAVVQQGQKNRLLTLDLGSSEAPRTPAPQGQPAPGRAWLTSALAVGTVGAVALGVFTFVDIAGQRDWDHCERSRACSHEELDSLTE